MKGEGGEREEEKGTGEAKENIQVNEETNQKNSPIEIIDRCYDESNEEKNFAIK
jgi:hypothetical protein